jgi:hypothetical protein
MNSSIAFCLSLIAISVLLLWSHFRDWHRTRRDPDQDEVDLDFGLKQFRRRVAASGMIGIIGLALLNYPRMQDPTRLSFWLYWGGLMFALLAIGLLVAIDVVMTKSQLRRLHRDGLVKKAALEAELQRLQRHRGNGHSH